MKNALRKQESSPVESLGVVGAPVLIREQTFDSLRSAIINGQLPPGTRLIERELCEAMGVSRTSIREVLRRLEAEKLIRSEPRKGPIVARVTRSQAEEIYDLRAYLEGLLLQRFVEKATPAQIDELNRIFHRFEKAAAKADVPDAVAIMAEFFGHISEAANTEVLNDILSQLTARVSYLRSTSMSQPGRIQRSVEEIRAIVEAVSQRDAKSAKKAAVQHVQSAAKIALARLAE